MKGFGVWLVVMLTLVTSSRGAEVVPPLQAPRDSLVRVTLAEGEKATVLNRDFTKVDVTLTPYGIAFVGPPDRYVIIIVVAEGIETIPYAIVDSKPPGPGPGPNPPGPDPPGPDPPDPGPPVPDNVPNRFGLGVKLFSAAVALANKSAAITLGNEAVQQANRLHRGQILPVTASANIANVASTLGSQWSALWAKAATDASKVAADQGNSQLVWRDLYWELGLSLQSAGGAR